MAVAYGRDWRWVEGRRGGGVTTQPTSPAPPGVSSRSPRVFGAPIESWWTHPSRRRGARARGGAVVVTQGRRGVRWRGNPNPNPANARSPTRQVGWEEEKRVGNHEARFRTLKDQVEELEPKVGTSRLICKRKYAFRRGTSVRGRRTQKQMQPLVCDSRNSSRAHTTTTPSAGCSPQKTEASCGSSWTTASSPESAGSLLAPPASAQPYPVVASRRPRRVSSGTIVVRCACCTSQSVTRRPLLVCCQLSLELIDAII